MSPSRKPRKSQSKSQHNPEASYEQLWTFFVAAAVTAFALQQLVAPKDVIVHGHSDLTSAESTVLVPELPFVK
ncbi:hypothetical protein WDW86_00350 [Bdellovibrionota bacterium FG-2]